jgi:histidinol-phosphate/aromatic aminotransferase/cobyric acid decarboxylase-like protein
VTHTPPAPQVYTWEPSNAAIAARYGLRAEDILRFDTNTSPVPPAFIPDALAGPFDPPLNEYPDSSYTDLTAAASAYAGVEPPEVILGAGADEVLDLVAKAYLPAGSAAFGPANPLRGHLRFTVRSRPENERLLEVVSALSSR